MLKSFIVITSIFEPTIAVRAFAKNMDHQLVIVGDKKGPFNWDLEDCEFLPIEKQEKLNFQLVNMLPYNHYCRKMLGYLFAISKGAEYIIDTDDDNIPNDDWEFPETYGAFDYLSDNLGFVNIYQFFSEQKVWPRGLPLNLINVDFSLTPLNRVSNLKVGIWQGLADEDPDVDAIYRMVSNEPVIFNKRSPIVLGKGTVSPFNTQNTFITKELFPLLYLPTFATFRYTDILRGLIAQPIMWNHGFYLGFTEATVIQKRNPHDYLRDFESEVPMYLTTHLVVDIVSSAISPSGSVCDNLLEAYKALLVKGIVDEREIDVLKIWISDIKNISGVSY